MKQFGSSLFLVLSFTLLLVLPSSARAAKKVDDGYRPISSDEVYNSGKNARVLYMQAQMAMRNHDLERAVKLSKRAVEVDPDDMDARVAYGEALYKKYLALKGSEASQPALYNECVKTWLVIHRSVVGLESDESYKGISIPLANKFFADDNRGILAKKRLESLCGRLPKFWETNNRYLKKVLKPESRVEGSVIGSDSAVLTPSGRRDSQ